MSPDSLLMLIVEASLGLAGFAGVVTALERRNLGSVLSSDNLNLVNLLATALGALFLSLGALALLSAEVDPASTWRVSSGAGLLLTTFFASRSAVVISRRIGPKQALRSGTLHAINLPLLAVCALQVWNVLQGAEFWPFLLLLIALFAVGCFSFVRLLMPPDA